MIWIFDDIFQIVFLVGWLFYYLVAYGPGVQRFKRVRVSAPGYIHEAAWLDDSTVALNVIDVGQFAWRWQKTRHLTLKRGEAAVVIAIPLLAVALFFG